MKDIYDKLSDVTGFLFALTLLGLAVFMIILVSRYSTVCG